MSKKHCLAAGFFAFCLWTVFPTISHADDSPTDRFVPLNQSDQDLDAFAKSVYQWWSPHGHGSIIIGVPAMYTQNREIDFFVGRLKAALMAQGISPRMIDARYYRTDQIDAGSHLTADQGHAIEVMIESEEDAWRGPVSLPPSFPPVPTPANQAILTANAQQLADAQIRASAPKPCAGKNGMDLVQCQKAFQSWGTNFVGHYGR